MKVLIAEDDQNIRLGLDEILRQEGYDTVLAEDGRQALALYEQTRPDFLCLDIMMPGMDGYAVCRQIRARDAKVPIVFISAKSEEIDRVLGLELGADDYILKPFGVREVVARIRAVTRRCIATEPATANTASFRQESFTMGDLLVLPAELRAKRATESGAESFELSLRDLKILQLLYRKQNQVVDRATLFDECWGFDHMPNSRSLDQHVSQLRKRIEVDPKNPAIIRTVHGVGYRYETGQQP